MIRHTLHAVVATLILTGAAHASLIQNGNFDQSNVDSGHHKYGNGFGDVVQADGWTFTNGSGILNDAIYAWGVSGTMAFLQNYSPFGWADPSLSQTFGANASSFTVSFKLRQRGGNQESVDVRLDGKAVAPTLTPVDDAWTTYSFNISGLTGSSHTLSFDALNLSPAEDSTLFVDDVSVIANEVPEPFSMALMLGGLGVMGWVRRRRA